LEAVHDDFAIDLCGAFPVRWRQDMNFVAAPGQCFGKVTKKDRRDIVCVTRVTRSEKENLERLSPAHGVSGMNQCTGGIIRMRTILAIIAYRDAVRDIFVAQLAPSE
jgi:hypothetical protein